jgi:hypothetical protein
MADDERPDLADGPQGRHPVTVGLPRYLSDEIPVTAQGEKLLVAIAGD